MDSADSGERLDREHLTEAQAGVDGRDRRTRGHRLSPGAIAAWRPRHAWVRLLFLSVAVLLVALSGAVVGVRIAGPTNASVGPVDTRMTLQPTEGGDTRIEVPPLGS